MQQFTLDVAVETGPTLDNFYALGNEAAVQHLRLWLADAKRRSPVPVYLWGGVGSGKSHLLQALRHALSAQGESFGWLDSTMAEPPAFDAQWRAVLLDDVHRYSAVQQHAAFNWFVNAQSLGCALVATGDSPPAQLLLRDDLRSRLGWGDIFALNVLPDEAQREVLRLNAQTRGLHLSDEVLDYMTLRFTRDLGNLVQWLDHLDRYALQTKRAITVPLLKDMVSHFDQLL